MNAYPKPSKKKILQAFNHAATSYNSVAQLQRTIADALLLKIPQNPKVIVDLGCGTGYATRKMHQQCPHARVMGIDFAQNMLHQAKKEGGDILWICADAESLPLSDQSCDLVFSSLMLQWCTNLNQTLHELYRLLKPGGLLLFSTLGPRTLFELKWAWQAVDTFSHVQHFKSKRIVMNGLRREKFSLCRIQTATYVEKFLSVRDMMKSLKKLGANYVSGHRAPGLMPMSKLNTLFKAYEKFRDADGYLPATYEVYFGIALS